MNLGPFYVVTPFRRAEPDTPVEALAKRSAVPLAATDPLYRSRNARVLEGLRRAAGLLAPRPDAAGLVAASPAAAGQAASTRFSPPQRRPKDASGATAHLAPVNADDGRSTTMTTSEMISQAAAALSLAKLLFPDTGRGGALVRRLRGLAARTAAWRERRAVLGQLDRMSDHDLADIGLVRSDIHRALDPELALERDASGWADSNLPDQMRAKPDHAPAGHCC